MPIDILIDYETLGGKSHNRGHSSVLELGAVAFEFNPESGAIPDYQQMVKSAFRVKFDIRSQKGIRAIDADTKDWWLKQSEEAKKVLYPSAEDVSVEAGHRMFADWVKEQGLTRGSQVWCRGNDFDFPILYNCLEQAGVPEKVMPPFWDHREVRTRIEAMLGRGVTECPVPLGKMPGFVHHSGIHDCAKDIMMLVYSYRYAFGMEEIPAEEDTEPCTIKKKR